MKTKYEEFIDWVRNTNPIALSLTIEQRLKEVIQQAIAEHEAENEVPDVLKSYWGMMMNAYLRRNSKLGIREFRIAMQDNNKFIIHPLGVDGETFDFAIDIETDTTSTYQPKEGGSK